MLLDRLGLRLAGKAVEGSALARLPTVIVMQAIDRNAADPTNRIVVLLDSAPMQVSLHEGLLHSV